VSWVRAAYICRVRREFSDDRSTQTCRAAFMVTDILPGECLPSSRQLLALLPSSLQEAGINVLTESAVSNVEPLGVQVYERSEVGQSV
jgi:NADH dehydrogenase FAD-containing subunit